MKKLKIVIALGLFIVLTTFLGMSSEKMYQKQKYFRTTDEIIQQMADKPLKVMSDKGRITETNELKECFSERMRLTDNHFNYGKIEIEKVNSLTEKQKKAILDRYEKLRSNFTKKREIIKEEPIRLTVNAYYEMYTEQGNIKYEKPQNVTLDMVVIDEGEGLVIDYVNYNHFDKSQEEGNEDA